jgi:DNA-directed RNA polymerase subunit RPC12/RpoP
MALDERFCAKTLKDREKREAERESARIAAEAEEIAAEIAAAKRKAIVKDADAAALAQAWITDDPGAEHVCLDCGKRFAVMQSGTPSLTCPQCGRQPSAEVRGYAIKTRAELRALRAKIDRPYVPYISNGEEYPSAADALAAMWAEDEPGATRLCHSCKRRFPLVQFGVPSLRCPFCCEILSDVDIDRALKSRLAIRADRARIDHLAELLAVEPSIKAAHRPTCCQCKNELSLSPNRKNHTWVKCPHCGQKGFFYDGEVFKDGPDCERVLEFRLEKKRKAAEEARQRELAETAKEIAEGSQTDGVQPNGGFLYVLVNSAMPGLLKIGKTERDTESRAKELSGATGIPTPFVVAYEEWFKDCSAAENYVHAVLASSGCRVADNREFFSAPVKVAIQAIMKAKAQKEQAGA